MSSGGVLRDDRVRAAIVLGANVATMGIGYLYQVEAARNTSSEAFLALSLWLGELGLLSVVGIFVQIRGTLVPPQAITRSPARLGCMIAAIAALILHIVFPGRLPPSVLLAETFVATMVSSYWAGVLIGAMHISHVALASLASAAVRWGYPHLFPGSPALYEANVLAALMLLALVTINIRSSTPEKAGAEAKVAVTSWTPVLLLGAIQAALPYAQLFGARAFADEASAADLARVMVLSRAPVLLGIALLNVALASRAREVDVTSAQPWTARYRFELFAVGQCLLAAPVLFAVGPWVSRVLMHADLSASRRALGLSTLHHAALLVVFALAQRHLLVGKSGRAIALVGAVALAGLALGLFAPWQVGALIGAHLTASLIASLIAIAVDRVALRN